MFVHKHKPAPPVYCSHGSNHLLNKQLLCLPAWVVCSYPVQGLGRTWRTPLRVSCGEGGTRGFNGGISCRGRCACSYYIVTVVWRYALLICDSVEVADKITWLFGLTVKSPLAECHPCRQFLAAQKGQRNPDWAFLIEVGIAATINGWVINYKVNRQLFWSVINQSE